MNIYFGLCNNRLQLTYSDILQFGRDKKNKMWQEKQLMIINNKTFHK